MKKFIALFSLFLGVFTLVGITANASELEEFEADLEPKSAIRVAKLYEGGKWLTLTFYNDNTCTANINDEAVDNELVYKVENGIYTLYNDGYDIKFTINDDNIIEEYQDENIKETALDFLKSLTKSELVVGLCATVGLGVIDVVAILLGIILFLRNKMKQLEKDERFAKILEDKDNEMVKAYDDFKAKLDEYGSMLVKRIDTLDEERKAEAEAKAKAIKDTLEKATSKLSE